MKNTLFAAALGGLMLLTTPALAAKYTIDTEGMHAFIQFRIKHLGYSWLYGRFNEFSGEFEYDSKAPEKSSVAVDIDVASIDTNHAKRDKHLRSDDFLDVKKFPKARFVSTEYIRHSPVTATVKGDLTLHGVTKPISMDIQRVGMGPDPWGGFRVGFEGRAEIQPSDWGIDMSALGKDAQTMEILLTAEGVRQDPPKGAGDKSKSAAKEKPKD